MALKDAPRFDESEDEEDFNPAPADLSDDEHENEEGREEEEEKEVEGEEDEEVGGEHEEGLEEEGGGGEEEEEEEEEEEKEEKEEKEEEEEEEAERAFEDNNDSDPQIKSDHESPPLTSRDVFAERDDDLRIDGKQPESAEDDDGNVNVEEEVLDEEEDDDEDVLQGHRWKRRQDRRNAFIDIEAEVDDEDEGEDEEKDGEEIEDFIDNAHPDDVAESARLDDDRRHRELDRRREMEASLDAEKQAEILRQRYGNRRPAKDLGDSSIVPRRLLLPSVDDPSIWAVRCKEGKEREVVLSITKRIEERQGTKDELAIIAAFERGGIHSVMKGFVYVEAQRQTDILAALDGMLNIYPRSKVMLVDIKDMPELLRISKTPNLEPGAWVRLRRPPKHSGDLAQVLDVTENGLEARVRFIPRLDYGVRDESLNTNRGDGKRKRSSHASGTRPPQRLFNEVEARKRHPRNVQGNPITKTWTYMGDEFENGFQVKDVKIQQLIVVDVNPSLEEVTKFASNAEDGTESLDLKALAASLKGSSNRVTYLPGDIVEVYAGEQRGVVGKAINVQGDIVTMTVTEGDLSGQRIEVPIKELRKRFRLGDHVKVIGGSTFRDEVGTVVKISEDRITLLTDQTHDEVTVFSKDLREASDIGGQGSLGQYALHDLVQLDGATVGCIVKVDRESLTVLDQYGDSRQVMPTQISNKLPKRRQAVAADRDGSEIRLDDKVKESSGQQRQGKIIHIHRSYIFLHTTDNTENAGIFVTKASLVTTIAAKGGRVNAAASGPDLNAMNRALKVNRNGADEKLTQQAVKIFGRDRAINQTAIIKKGPYKGLLGIVKDTTDTHARVELHTKGKTVTVPRTSLSFRDKASGAAIDINGRGRVPSGAYGRGFNDRVPGWGNGSRTPYGSAGAAGSTAAWGSRTPAILGGRTPGWKAQEYAGSRTPAWADGSRTVNPYDGNRTAYGGGGRTPAWQSTARTPASSDVFAAGSQTPAYGAPMGLDGWASGSKTPAWGMSAPTPGHNSWGETPAASHATSFDAPTPGAALSAPTPNVMSAPTPGAFSAPTPGGGWQGGWGSESAPTPGAAAPTPAASGYYGAPTPAAYDAGYETPAPAGPRYTDDD